MKKCYLLDEGILLTEQNPDFASYSLAYDNKYGYYDEDQCYLESKEEAIRSAKSYVEQGVDRTYAVVSVSMLNCDAPCVDLAVRDEKYTVEDVIYSVAKINGEIIENFINDLAKSPTTSISMVAYELYKQDWIDTHTTPEIRLDDIRNWGETEILNRNPKLVCPYEECRNEFGYAGELYVCYDEFIDAEYQDCEYMEKLLSSQKLIDAYKKDEENLLQVSEPVVNDEEIPFISKYESIFKIGQEYLQVGFFGGTTVYVVKEIDRKNKKILLAEKWYDVDGSGTRPAKWHQLEKEDGKEKFLEWTSKDFGDVWVYAHTNY